MCSCKKKQKQYYFTGIIHFNSTEQLLKVIGNIKTFLSVYSILMENSPLEKQTFPSLSIPNYLYKLTWNLSLQKKTAMKHSFHHIGF